MEEWIRLGHDHGIPVYGGLSWKHVFDHVEAVRGAAYRLWDEGVDGLHIFNFLDPARFQSLSEIGDPDALAGMDKMYQIDLDRKRVGYMNDTLWPEQLPLSFSTQSGSAQHDLGMRIADRPEKASRITVQTRWDLASESDRISWRLNGQKQPYPRAVTGDRAGWVEWETHDLQKGENTFQVTVQPPESGDASKPVSLEELRVWVRYG